MVSFWPWRGNSSSTASFEKTLSTLSTRITNLQSKLDKVRSSSRRVKVLWTLYLTFAYLVYGIVLLLVVGYKKMGAYEWTGMAGGPVLIYTARTLIGAYFNFRIESLSARLKEQQEERAKTIQKLKDATKYDSTLELIEKYGGAEGKPKPKDADGDDNGQGKEQQSTPQRQLRGRTTGPPPPTANIQRSPSAAPGTPQSMQGGPFPPPNEVQPEALYAPNADFEPDNTYVQPIAAAAPRQYATGPVGAPAESHWYDRIFDVLLGEDETAPKNRIVLICKSCRLVNGQAPPGTKTLAELGLWKCMACRAANGEIDEGRRIVKEVLAADKKEAEAPAEHDDGPEDASAEDGADDVHTTAVDTVDDGPAASVRKRRAKGKK